MLTLLKYIHRQGLVVLHCLPRLFSHTSHQDCRCTHTHTHSDGATLFLDRTPDVCACDAGWSGRGCDADELVTRAKQLLDGHHPRQARFTSLVFNRAVLET